MANAADARVIVDGTDHTDEVGPVEFHTPFAVHEIPDDEPWTNRVLGPSSFTILISAPSDRLYALVDGGETTHEVKLIAADYSITRPTHFHKGWVGADGVRKMFGSLAVDREREAKWVQELPAGASTATEGN
ncbi:hypothetical protein AB0E62_27485 [Streptomyces sp. NPDC038707]|uniref:hypothetical protein n=1 Tax=Streptomyces sp. NPDC038707 TaxID=3154329 RepID=UPI0033ED5D13